MKYLFLGTLKFVNAILFLLLINTAIEAAPSSRFIKIIREFQGGVKSEAVWDSHLLRVKWLEEKCHGSASCTAATIKKLGASSQAVAFAAWQAGLITRCHRYDNIYYFIAWLPGSTLRMSVFVGNSAGQLFRVDNWLDVGQQKPLANRKAYIKLLGKVYHNTPTRYGVELSPEYEKLAASQQVLIFNYPLIDRCKAVDGCVKVAFIFDKQGRFTKAKFLTIKSYAPAYKVAIGCNKKLIGIR